MATVLASVLPSIWGMVSGGRSVGVGLPSACSSLGMFRLELERLVLVQVELWVRKYKRKETMAYIMTPPGKGMSCFCMVM